MQNIIYLNNSATSFPKPQRVLKRIVELLEKPPINHARTGFTYEDEDALDSARSSLATLFNVKDKKRICFSSGATESINLILQGLDLEGKHVITTAVEHNSILRPLKSIERDRSLSLSIVGCDTIGMVNVNEIKKAICKNTAAIVVNHCSNVTGAVNDIAGIGSIARSFGIPFIVDTAQSAGTYSIDVQSMNIDALVFTGHKALYGIQGIGGAYISENLSPKPLKTGGTGVRSDYLYQPETLPLYYEAGTQNVPGAASLFEGVSYINEIGIDSIRCYKEQVVEEMQERIEKLGPVRCIPDSSCKVKSTLFSFTVEGMDPADLGYILEENFNIITRTGLHCAPLIHEYLGTVPEGTVRISPSYFTTEMDIDLFINAVKNILQGVVSR